MVSRGWVGNGVRFIRGDLRWDMRAVAARSFGAAPEVMDLPAPSPGPRELIVRVEAAGMNPYDGKILDGLLRPRPHTFPLIAGIDAAGQVVATGPEVRRFRPGDRVFGQFLHDPVGTGTYAELAPVPETIGIARVPADLSSREAAALPTAGMTALDSLDRLSVAPGGAIVIVGASGGVGSIATQIASGRGIEVLAVARPRSAERLHRLGADTILDGSDPDWAASLRNRRPDGVDAVLDLMSDAARFAQNLRIVRPGGRAATTTYAAGPDLVPPRGVEVLTIDLQPSAALLERLTQEVRARRLGVPVERTVSLEQAPEVLAEIRSGRGAGKTVIALGEAPGSRP